MKIGNLKKKMLTGMLFLVSASMFSAASYADKSYAYMHFDRSKLAQDLQLKVLNVQFSKYVGYGERHFNIGDTIETGTESGFRATQKYTDSMTVTIGTPDWQHYCQIEANVYNDSSVRDPGTGANVFRKAVINWQQSKALNCEIVGGGPDISKKDITIKVN